MIAPGACKRHDVHQLRRRRRSWAEVSKPKRGNRQRADRATAVRAAAHSNATALRTIDDVVDLRVLRREDGDLALLGVQLKVEVVTVVGVPVRGQNQISVRRDETQVAHAMPIGQTDRIVRDITTCQIQWQRTRIIEFDQVVRIGRAAEREPLVDADSAER